MCRINKMCKINKNKIDTTNLKIDLGKSIDDLINLFNDDEELGVCGWCDLIDINNEYNFKKVCSNCEEVFCLECFEELKKTEEIDEQINNYKEGENQWLCGDCGNYCSMCDSDYIIEDMLGLIDREGDEEYFCLDCVNGNNLDIEYDDNYYNEILCRIREDEVEDFGSNGVITCYECNYCSKYDDDVEFYKLVEKIICDDCVNDKIYHC